jgi:hypothetical protein
MAGGGALFVKNLRRWDNDEDLEGLVDLEAGY